MPNSKKQNKSGNPTTPKKDNNKPEKLTDSMSQEECLQFFDDHYGPTVESLFRPEKVVKCYLGAAEAIADTSREDCECEELLVAWVLRNPGFRPYERHVLSTENGVEDWVTLIRLRSDLMRHPEDPEYVAKLSEVAKNLDLATKGFTSAVQRRMVPAVQEDKDTVNAPSVAESPAINIPVLQSPGIEAPIVKAPTVQGQSENARRPSHHTKTATPSPLPQRKSPLEKSQPSPSITPKSWRKGSLPYTKRGVQFSSKTPSSPSSPQQATAEDNRIFAAGIAHLQYLERQLAAERAKCLHLETEAKEAQLKASETQQGYEVAVASAEEANRKHEQLQKHHDNLTLLLQKTCSYLAKLENHPYAAEILPAHSLATIVELDKLYTESDMASLPRVAPANSDREIHNMNIAFGLAALLFLVPVQWHLKLRHDAASLGQLDDVLDMLFWLQYAFTLLNYVGIGLGGETGGGFFTEAGEWKGDGVLGEWGTWGGAGVSWELPALGVVVWKWCGEGGWEVWEVGVWVCMLGGLGWRSVVLGMGVSLVTRAGLMWLLV
ncbi:MAG: hypothetical protein LQ350_003259 [Teloschistes chrysophthalmus]|nr:MAG: hypothetical protein LQ350_003259 [Niorma chrysophthalma]